MDVTDEIKAARAKLAARMGGARTGGRGSVRRKRKARRKTAGTDDKRLQQALKRLGVQSIPAIEEVNIFKKNGEVIHFVAPKVQANIQSNTYVIIGRGETKKLQELLPDIISQLGPDNLASLRSIASSITGDAATGEGAAAGDAAEGGDSDDDIPDLVDSVDFEAASKVD
eukprot:PLAT5140.1.p2 GENE.PLAT5140.1~~PLAT5140.1.p2  ORF type:complete len:170 (-),score=75.56 PLAT5140.1:205-714(-)